MDGTAVVDLRDALVRLAALLGCSEGTVKPAASRGLRRLRDLAGSQAGMPCELMEGRS